MKLTLTNTADTPLPIFSSDGDGWTGSLDPGERNEINLPDSDQVIIGDKSDALDDVEENKKSKLREAIEKLIERWKGAINKVNPIIFVTIENDGPKTIRVILGTEDNQSTVAPGDSIDAEAADYIEIRQVGAKR